MPGIVKFGIKSWRLGLPERLIYLLAVLFSAILLTGCNFETFTLNHRHLDNINLLLGNPSAATADITNAQNYLLLRPQYALSYNRNKGSANWVSWQLNQSWIGKLPRIPFAPDPSLPTGWYQVMPGDYTGSGFDRGHMVPAADRDRTEADSKAVFLMTNILPQAPDNNRGPWEKLESYCRQLVEQGKELYIFAGGAGSGGIGEKGRKITIAGGEVIVPANFWKVVVVLDQPELGLRGVTKTTRAIAVIMPNEQGIKEKDWQIFRTSVDAVEELTGYNFLLNVPQNIQNLLEAKIDVQ